MNSRNALATAAVLVCVSARPAAAQEVHQHAAAAPASREASGTAWLPDETPMHGLHRTRGGWELMLHGHLIVQFLYEPGDIHRTGGFSRRQLSSVNWAMVMARRPAGAGRVGLRAMLSAEPWTVRDCGVINLLASGEMCDGDTIHDRQHAHDLFMELAADYDRPLRGSLRWQLYAGLSGEPALGPAGFPHRLSSMPNPAAPISHHWLDSTHIAFGVVTTGLYGPRWKAELSWFNGREPDDHRGNLDLSRLDSVSGRVSFLPTPRLALQVSAAHLAEAEAEFPPQPRSDLTRATASATYHRVTADSTWATTLAYGINAGPEIIPGVGSFDTLTGAVLLESAYTRGERHTWFGRAEIVEKPAHDLHAHEWIERVFTVGKVQAGYVGQSSPRRGVALGLGGFVSAGLIPPELTNRYFRRLAPGFGVFVSLRPAPHAP